MKTLSKRTVECLENVLGQIPEGKVTEKEGYYLRRQLVNYPLINDVGFLWQIRCKNE